MLNPDGKVPLPTREYSFFCICCRCDGCRSRALWERGRLAGLYFLEQGMGWRLCWCSQKHVLEPTLWHSGYRHLRDSSFVGMRSDPYSAEPARIYLIILTWWKRYGIKHLINFLRTNLRSAFVLRLVFPLKLARVCNVPDSNFRQNCRVFKRKNTGQRKHHLIKKTEREKKCPKCCFKLRHISVLPKVTLNYHCFLRYVQVHTDCKVNFWRSSFHGPLFNAFFQFC